MNQNVSAVIVPASPHTLPGVPPLVAKMPDVPTSVNPTEAIPEIPPNESATVCEVVSLPAALSQDPFVRLVGAEAEASRLGPDQLVGHVNEVHSERDERDSVQESTGDRKTNPRIDTHQSRKPASPNTWPRLDQRFLDEVFSEKEEHSKQDALYGQITHDDILEDTFRNRSTAEDGRSSHGNASNRAPVPEEPPGGFANGSMGVASTKAEKKRRKKQNKLRTTTDDQASAVFAGHPQSRPTSSLEFYDNPLQASNCPTINDYKLADPGDLGETRSPVFPTERPSSIDGYSDGSVCSERKQKGKKQAKRSARAKPRQRSVERVDESASTSPPTTVQVELGGRDGDANVERDRDGDESGHADRHEFRSAKCKSEKTRTSRSMKDRLKRVKEKVTGMKKKSQVRAGEEESSCEMSAEQDDAFSEPSSATGSDKPVSLRKGKSKTYSPDLGTTLIPSIPRSSGMSAPSLKSKAVKVGGVAVDPSMVVGVVLLGVAIFRGASASPAGGSGVIASSTDTDPTAITSIYIWSGVTVLIFVVFLGVWFKIDPQKISNRDRKGYQGAAIGTAGSSEPNRAADKANKASLEEVEQEDDLLRGAQEQVKELFPQRNMQSAAFIVFYDLMHAPWQDPDPESLQRLRMLARKEWGKDYKSKFKTAVESLREVAIQLFADYLRVHDRGAYLSGELLRVEVASGREAIRISPFQARTSTPTLTYLARRRIGRRHSRRSVNCPTSGRRCFPVEICHLSRSSPVDPPRISTYTSFTSCGNAQRRRVRLTVERGSGITRSGNSGRRASHTDCHFLESDALWNPPRITHGLTCSTTCSSSHSPNELSLTTCPTVIDKPKCWDGQARHCVRCDAHLVSVM